MKRGDPELTFILKSGKHNRDGLDGGSESDESWTPKKTLKTNNVFNRLMMDDMNIDGSWSSGDETASNISPSTPPIFNHRNASRRKGIPHRAPF